MKLEIGNRRKVRKFANTWKHTSEQPMDQRRIKKKKKKKYLNKKKYLRQMKMKTQPIKICGIQQKQF